MGLAIPIIGTFLDKAGDIIDKLVPDGDLRAKLKHDIEMSFTTRDHEEIMALVDARAKILAAEITGKSWLQRNWRPILMLVIVAIVANNYLLYPYLMMLGVPATTLDLPPELWNLMSLGVGGYIVGRSAEKFAKEWKRNGN